MPLRAGDPAPDFVLPLGGGGTASLERLRGRKAVLFFYPKDDTSGCTREAQDFSRLRDDFAAAGTELLGISPDGPRSHERFKAKHGLDLALASDESREALEAYGVWTEKSLYGRRYRGVERTTVLLDREGRVARVWTKVKVPGHAEAVLAAARAL